MAYTLTMPEVGETVTEGTIEKWLKQPGDHIEKYEPIVEINTDKVNVELPSPVSGTLVEIRAQEGATVPIGGELAIIDEVAGETPAKIAPPAPAEKQPAREPAKAGVATKPQEQASVPASPPAQDGAGERQRATPRVRKLAAELGVDLARLTGTGAGGRIIEDDVRAAQKATPGTPPKAAPTAPLAAAPTAAPVSAGAGADEEAVPLTAIRRTIAQRMAASASAAPHAWLVVEADVTGLVALRQAEKEAFHERHGIDLTYLPFAAHAVAQAVLEHPYLNAAWAEDRIVLKKRVHLGIAVATERGLLVPVVHDADRLSVGGLARAMADLGERARTNKLTLEDVQAGTFTLDNTGAFGSVLSQPIINLGQAAIISLEAITRQPRIVGDNAIGVRSVVNLCLSFDHRILDGHLAGAFLGDVKRRLETLAPDTGLD